MSGIDYRNYNRPSLQRQWDSVASESAEEASALNRKGPVEDSTEKPHKKGNRTFETSEKKRKEDPIAVVVQASAVNHSPTHLLFNNPEEASLEELMIRDAVQSANMTGTAQQNF